MRLRPRARPRPAAAPRRFPAAHACARLQARAEARDGARDDAARADGRGEAREGGRGGDGRGGLSVPAARGPGRVGPAETGGAAGGTGARGARLGVLREIWERARQGVGRRVLRGVGLLGSVVVAWMLLRGSLPGAGATWAALRKAEPAWLVAAVGFQVGSVAAFGLQQRRLLAVFGVRAPVRWAVGLAYARTAMAIALPAGSVVSAGYAFRQFRGRGAEQDVALAAMTLSAAASTAGLAVLYAGSAAVWAFAPWPVPVAVALLAVVAVVAFLPLAARPPAPHRAPDERSAAEAEAGPGAREWVKGMVRRAAGAVRGAAGQARTVGAARSGGVLALAVLNWLADLACLVAAVRALGLEVSVPAMAGAYLGVQFARQIPTTPGGIGVIEGALLLAFTTVGVAAAPAAAAVLVYRLLSCWLLLPVGLLFWAAHRTAPRPGAPGA
ncbi:hypothetical protein EDD29_6380 [Actinocorallia herbida]|uniref:Lysylphosphatidylglycerol synthase-like protein n=1 Tax=Actinocorallia herbida TaxID=58109 RepID=A0A3N1D578_9ACTN|nr:hypothetical protein EDD29_6380 [Actinocorallia herbida]